MSVISAAKSAKARKLTVKWGKVPCATAYKVEYRVKGTSAWKRKSAAKKTKVTLKGLKKGKKYQVRIVASGSGQTSTSATVLSNKVK